MENLWITLPECRMMFRDHPDIAILDSTYRTNKYNLPLLQVIGRTTTMKNFLIGVCFLSSEDEVSYFWAMTAFREVCESLSVTLTCLVSDCSLALKNALTRLFPHTSQLICKWHIARNVKQHAHKEWPHERIESKEEHQSVEKSRREFMSQWTAVIEAVTQDSFREAWNQMTSMYEDRQILDYVSTQWYPYRNQWAMYMVKHVRHFDNRYVSAPATYWKLANGPQNHVGNRRSSFSAQAVSRVFGRRYLICPGGID